MTFKHRYLTDDPTESRLSLFDKVKWLRVLDIFKPLSSLNSSRGSLDLEADLTPMVRVEELVKSLMKRPEIRDKTFFHLFFLSEPLRNFKPF